MEVTHPICCGIDVHNQMLVACLRRDLGAGRVEKETRQFSTTRSHLEEMQQWLTEHDCPVVAMESTGVYWKPVYHVLSRKVEVVVGNAREMRRPTKGKKTDKSDASWIGELLAHGLITPSFIPSPEISALRELTRTRTSLVENRTQVKNRIHKVLQDSCIKLSSVASNVFGKSGRAMLDALVAGERDAKKLAELARGTLRKKIEQLGLALDGMFTDGHALLIQMNLSQLDLLEAQIAQLDVQIAKMLEPHQDQVEQLTSIPGIDKTAAGTIIGEIGLDMSQFGSSGRLASWAGVCPGNNESAGKRRSGKTRRGNRWLRRILVQCAWTVRKSDSFLGHKFRALQRRIGGKKAAMAVAHKLLTIVYHLLLKGTHYEENRYLRPNPRVEARRRNHAVATLTRLGYDVTLVPQSA